MTYLPIYEIVCGECESTPVVGLLSERGDSVRSTNLCGSCFFRDLMMVNEEYWNDQPEATE